MPSWSLPIHQSMGQSVLYKDPMPTTKLLSIIALTALSSTACAVTSHPTTKASLGTTRSAREMMALVDQPGPIEVVTVASADWVVPRSGVLDLDAPKAKAAKLEDRDEPIQIFFHALRHPQRGLFVVDSGVERALRDAPDRAAVRGLVTKVMHLDALHIREPLGDWLAKQPTPLAGVLLTHLHLDHIMGLPDVPRDTPIYTGPGEASASSMLNAFVRGHSDRALADKPALRELGFQPDAAGRFAGVLDVFGDGSLWALWVPGHTPGSTAYLARTPKGPVLLVGDTCHTRWGWDHGVAPGSFTADAEDNARSLAQLQQLVAEHPKIDVRLGHQP